MPINQTVIPGAKRRLGIHAGDAGTEIYTNQDLKRLNWRDMDYLLPDLKRAKDFLSDNAVPFGTMNPIMIWSAAVGAAPPG